MVYPLFSFYKTAVPDFQFSMLIILLINNFINNIAYLERIFETLDEPVTISDKEGAHDIGAI